MITHDHDLVLHFYDLSAQSLVSSFDEPLTNSLPDPLPSLTIELSALLFEPSLRPTPSDPAHTTAAEADSPEIDSILLAPDSLECITVFRNGAVILHRLDVQSTGDPPELEDDELVSLAHLSVRNGLRYSPFCAIRSKYGRVTACAISDVGESSFECKAWCSQLMAAGTWAGFLAVAYNSGGLLVVDLRGPRVILRHAPPRNKEHRHSLISRSASAERLETVASLTWTICPIASGSSLSLALLFCEGRC